MRRGGWSQSACTPRAESRMRQVWRSTGFEPWQPRAPELHGEAARVADACRAGYERLYAHRLRV